MEKEIDVSHAEKQPIASLQDTSTSPVFLELEMSPIKYRKLMWKLDMHLLPPLFALWFVSSLESSRTFTLTPRATRSILP
jgi:hypothetical protein